MHGGRLRSLALLAALSSACGGTPATASTSPDAPPSVHPEALPMDTARWELSATEADFGEHLGRSALRLRGGFAFLRDLKMSDGIIEFDMAAEPGVAFAGITWHGRDDKTFEKIYLRPFLSDSREATQYTPVWNGINGWQLYHGPGYNQPVHFTRNAWTSVRVVVSGELAELYVDDMDTPLFTVRQRLPDRTGNVALYVEPIPSSMSTSGVWFSNVRVTSTDKPQLRGTVADEQVAGRVPTWRVSSPFSAESTLPADGSLPKVAGWTPLTSEPSGLLNLAQAHGLGRGEDTVLACTTVVAEQASDRRLRFGFSESARVWWNGRPLYDGDDTWHSRDITFQGVVGYYDGLWLPANEGPNELCMAVTENVGMMGGWGLLAAFEKVEGLSFDAGAAAPATDAAVSAAP